MGSSSTAEWDEWKEERARRDAEARDRERGYPSGTKAQRDRAVELLRRLVSVSDNQDASHFSHSMAADEIAGDARTFLASLDAAPGEEG